MNQSDLERLAALQMAHPSDLTLEKLRFGELAPDQAAAAQAHVDGCERCQAIVKTTFADIPEADSVKLLAGIRRGLDERPKGLLARLRWLFGPLAVAATAAVALLVLLPRQDGDQEEIRTKGKATLHVFRLKDGAAVEVVSGEVVRPGEPLRFKIDLERESQVFIVGSGGDGKLYRVWPTSGASRLAVGRGHEVPEAVSLDTSPGDEFFHLVACGVAVEAPSCTARGPGEAPACTSGCTSSPFRLSRGP